MASWASDTSREGSEHGTMPDCTRGGLLLYSPRANRGPKTAQARGQTQPAHTTPRETSDNMPK